MKINEKPLNQEQSVRNSPIKLDDLLPKQNVTGGKAKQVFGSIKRQNQYKQP